MNTTQLSTEELAAELARRQTAHAAEQQRRAEALRLAQDEHAEHILAVQAQLDSQLAEEGRQQQEAAVQALRDLDLSAAFAAFTLWKATRVARSDIRNRAQNAAARLGKPQLPDLRDVHETFGEWLQRETSGMSRPELFLADGRADELLGTAPTSYEDLES